MAGCCAGGGGGGQESFYNGSSDVVTLTDANFHEKVSTPPFPPPPLPPPSPRCPIAQCLAAPLTLRFDKLYTPSKEAVPAERSLPLALGRHSREPLEYSGTHMPRALLLLQYRK